jgi:hypothetical protein
MADRSVVRELITLIGFDVDEKTLKDVDRQVDLFKKNLRRMSIAAGIAAGAIAGVVVKTVQLGNNIAKNSRRLTIAASTLQELRFAFAQANIEQTAFDIGFQKFVKNVGQFVTTGKGPAEKAFRLIRLQVRDLNGEVRPLNELFIETLKLLNSQETQAKRNALAAQIFEDVGARLFQVFEDGESTIEGSIKRFRELGGVIDDETIKAAEELSNKWGELKVAMQSVLIEMGKFFLPATDKAIGATTNWVARNRELLSTIGLVAIGLAATTALIFGFAAAQIGAAASTKLLGASLGSFFKLATIGVLKLLGIFALLFLIIEDLYFAFTGGRSLFAEAFNLENLKLVFARVQEAITVFLDGLRTSIRTWWQDVIADLMQALPPSLQNILHNIFFRRGSPAVSTGAPRLFGPRGSLAPRLFGERGAFSNFNRPANLFGAGGALAGSAAGIRDVSVTINQAPGETGTQVADNVLGALRVEGIDLDAATTSLGQ